MTTATVTVTATHIRTFHDAPFPIRLSPTAASLASAARGAPRARAHLSAPPLHYQSTRTMRARTSSSSMLQLLSTRAESTSATVAVAACPSSSRIRLSTLDQPKLPHLSLRSCGHRHVPCLGSASARTRSAPSRRPHRHRRSHPHDLSVKRSRCI
jgi:hypothetical protein